MESEKSNLLRIRENQRRSRARKKDHVQELEAKLRRCELQGVEASSEIQLAARKVADENKRLRKLLAQYAIAGTSIETTGENETSNLEGEAVQVLEALLVARKCCTSRTPSSNTEGLYMAVEGRNGSAISSPDVDEPDIAITCSSSTPSSFMPMTAPQAYLEPPFEPSIEVSQPSDARERQPRTRQDYHNAFTPGSQISDLVEYNTPFYANGCILAADMITTMAGGDPLTVREELGCSSNMDCEVDNAVVFNVMGRYTGAAGV